MFQEVDFPQNAFSEDLEDARRQTTPPPLYTDKAPSKHVIISPLVSSTPVKKVHYTIQSDSDADFENIEVQNILLNSIPDTPSLTQEDSNVVDLVTPQALHVRGNTPTRPHQSAIARRLNFEDAIEQSSPSDVIQVNPSTWTLEDLDRVLEAQQNVELTDIFGRPGQVYKACKIIEVDAVPEYPECPTEDSTHIGVLFVINLSLKDTTGLHSYIQYSHKAKGGGRPVVMKYNNVGKINFRAWGCRGVKVCEGVNSTIIHNHTGGASAETVLRNNAKLTLEHYSAQITELPASFAFGNAVRNADKEAKTYAFIQELERLCRKRGFCKLPKCTGLPELKAIKIKTRQPLYYATNGTPVWPSQWIISCTRYDATSKRQHHTYHWNIENEYDIGLLTKLFAQMLNRLDEEVVSSDARDFACSAIYHYASKKKYCRDLHGISTCAIQNTEDIRGPCEVLFTFLTPMETTSDQHRAYLYVTGKEHNHAPSPPDKTPSAILKALKIAMADLGSSLFDQGPLKVFQHPSIQNLSGSSNCADIGKLHPSLKADMLSGLLYRQRVSICPEGRSFEGVRKKYLRESNGPSQERYIRCAVYNHELNCHFVICFTELAASALYAVEYFEADLAFKRVKGAFNEIEIITRNEHAAVTVTHARIFIDREAQETYVHAFKLLFETIANVLNRKPLTFHHIDPESNLHAMVCDFDTKQASALGLYLQSVDPDKLAWQHHVKQCIRYCKVHFLRGIDRKYMQHAAKSYMCELLQCTSEAEYDKHLDKLVELWPEVRPWAAHKKHDYVKAGLLNAVSGINHFVWQRIPSHTNHSESAHNAANRRGTGLTLLSAIESSFKQDLCTDRSIKHMELTGARVTQRSKSMTTEIGNAWTQKERRSRARNRRLQVEGNQQTQVPLLNVPISCPTTPTKPQYNVSSSGSVRTKKSTVINREVPNDQFQSVSPIVEEHSDDESWGLPTEKDLEVIISMPESIASLWFRQSDLKIRESEAVCESISEMHSWRLARRKYKWQAIESLVLLSTSSKSLGEAKLQQVLSLWERSLSARERLLNSYTRKATLSINIMMEGQVAAARSASPHEDVVRTQINLKPEPEGKLELQSEVKGQPEAAPLEPVHFTRFHAKRRQ